MSDVSADPEAAEPEVAGPAPVSPVAAAVLLVAAVVVAALVSVSVARLVPFDEDEAAVEASRPVPAEPAGAGFLDGVAPLATFDGSAATLPEGWSVEAGAWAVADGAARATDVGDEGALAVVAAPEGAEMAQVTVRDPEPGAGRVGTYGDVGSYVALQVGRTGTTVQLVQVDGRRLQPRVLITAELTSPDAPLVLALRRHLGGYEAVANGDRIGRRSVAEEGVPGPWRVGLTTGRRPTATGTAFDDLVVA